MLLCHFKFSFKEDKLNFRFIGTLSVSILCLCIMFTIQYYMIYILGTTEWCIYWVRGRSKWIFTVPSSLSTSDHSRLYSHVSTLQIFCKYIIITLIFRLRPCLYVYIRVSFRVYMISVHRDVPGDRDVSISLKKKAWNLIIICR